MAVSVLLILKKKWGKVSWIFQNSSIWHIADTFSYDMPTTLESRPKEYCMRIWIYCLSIILVFFVCFQRITFNFRDTTGDQQVPETTIQITAEDVTLNQTAVNEIKPDKRKKSQDKID